MKGSMVLFIAIVVGALAAVLANKQINSEIAEKTDMWKPRMVCLAKRTLYPGDVIDIERDIDFKAVPEELAMKGYVLQEQASTLDKQTVNVEITKGKMMDRYYLGRVEIAKDGANQLNPDNNNRLIPIKVSEVTGIAGYLKQGDKVDVLHTNKNKQTQMMLQNVKIRHVGRAGLGRSGRRSSYSSVTVEVPPRSAMALTNAMETGTIMLIKRTKFDGTVIPYEEVLPINPTQDYHKTLSSSGQ